MAYKYQLGAATMSGSLTQEGMIEVKDQAGAVQAILDDTGTVSGSSHFSAGGNLTVAGTVKLNGAADATFDVAADSLYFRDADGTLKRDSFDDIMTAIAGSGLANSSGVLSVDIDELTAGTTLHQTEDSFMYSDNGTEKKITFSDLQDSVFADVSGDATIAAGGALTIAAGAVEHGMLNDNIISGQDELAHADIADADELMISDDGTVKRVGVDSLRDHYFGVVSGDATIADGGALTIAADAVEDSMVNDNVATGLAGVGLSAASGVMALDLNELTEETLASGDFFAFVDSTDNGTHKETVDDLATLFAGTGLAAASAVLSVDLNELSAAAVSVAADSIAIIDADDNSTKKESIADLMTATAGAGLAAASGVLSVDIDELDAGTTLHQTEDHFMYSDNGTEKKITFSDLQDSVFADVSGDATIAAGGALTIGADAVESGMLNDNIISGQTELAQGALAAADEFLISDGGTIKRYGVDSLAKDALALTTEAAAAVADDYIVFLDGGATGETKKESISDLVGSMAGAGLTATSGVLSVTGNNVALKADGDSLVEGYNYFADLSGADATVTMPAAPAVGDVVTAKAGNLGAGDTITINKGSADHRIDGLEGIVIESPFGAVTMVYVVADHWKIV